MKRRVVNYVAVQYRDERGVLKLLVRYGKAAARLIRWSQV